MKRQWTRDELADHWILTRKELELLANKSAATRLGFAVLLKAFMLEGRFPRQKHDVPGVVIVHVANQVSSQRLYPARKKVPLQGVVPPAIEELVVHKDAKGNQRVDRINYEICVLRELRERLRCKEIWVVGADRYRNPDEDLPQDFEIKRDSYYAELGQPRDVEAFIADLQQTMRASLDTLDRGLPRNRVSSSNGSVMSWRTTMGMKQGDTLRA